MTAPIPSLSTPRLTLRPFSQSDVDLMFELMAEPEVLRYFPAGPPLTRERVERMIQGILRHWHDRGYGLWAVNTAIDGRFLGRCGLQYLPDTDEVEVDFLLGKPSWGRGFATEAGRASLRYGFAELDVGEIVGIVHPGNLASQRVLEKLGLTRIEATRYFGMDVFRYAIGRTDYQRGAEADPAGRRTSQTA